MNGSELSILYRGSLSSCNYSCDYCPFAKVRADRNSLKRDAEALARFVTWAEHQTNPLSVLFTPLGEAFIYSHYQLAIASLGNHPQTRRVAIQTNLSLPVQAIEDCASDKLALWCSYHPSQVTRKKFIDKCFALLQLGIPFSVGVVGNREELDEIRALRQALPDQVYMWVNANRAEQMDYRPEELALFRAVDPLFDFNLPIYPSQGRSCHSGDRVISVDGDGRVQRCHFVMESLGNLFDGSFQKTFTPCPNATCDCHIGYVHMPDLKLYERFGSGVLERRPENLV
ncbi:MAG: STM4011 family radical SAM protein [Candidatus Thiodiazotropha sp.]|jgi:MoaA/NifB/PqqE/SkfB family radical SAM enzyme